MLAEDSLAIAATQAIKSGDLETLVRLLRDHPELATSTIRGCGGARSLLHIATDWPGGYPSNVATVKLLVAAGADVNARFEGRHEETPLHWAASNDDVAVIDALLDAGADIEARGAVIAGGTPLSDAVAFGQWKAARRLVERGARTTFREAAALGLLDRVEALFSADEVDQAFWYACHGGQQAVATALLERGADRNWISPWDGLTPLDAARRSEAAELAAWLVGQGARSAGEQSR